MTLSNGQTASASPSCTINSTDGQSTSVGVTANFTSTATNPPLTGVSMSTTNLIRTVFSGGTYTIGSASATPVGGTAPFTYAWSPSSSGGVSSTGSTGSSASFNAYVDQFQTSKSGSFSVTITDALGASASGGVTATLNFEV
jgi:hypothetical protein